MAALDGIGADSTARTKAILEAIASGGNAGLKAFNESEAALTQARQSALDLAAKQAALIGGPEVANHGAAVGQGYDRALANNKTLADGFQADMARRGTAQADYLKQVAAAVPLVKADTERQLAMYKAKLDASRASESSASGAESFDDLSDSELRTRLLGQAALDRETYNSDLDQTISDETKPVKFGNRPLSFMTPKGLTALTPKGATAKKGKADLAGMTDGEVALDVASQMNIDPARARGLLNPSIKSQRSEMVKAATHPADADLMKRARLTPSDLASVKNDPDYNRLREKIARAVAVGLPWKEIAPLLSTLPAHKARSMRALIAEFKR